MNHRAIEPSEVLWVDKAVGEASAFVEFRILGEKPNSPRLPTEISSNLFAHDSDLSARLSSINVLVVARVLK